MILKKYTFKSEKNGPSVLFLGAVHGNEPAGTKAIYMVLEKFASKALTPLKGSVSFIPVCNPVGLGRVSTRLYGNAYKKAAASAAAFDLLLREITAQPFPSEPACGTG